MSRRRSAPRAWQLISVFTLASLFAGLGCGRSSLEAEDLFGEGGSPGVGGTSAGGEGVTGGARATGGASVNTGGRFVTGGAGGQVTGGAGGQVTGGAGGQVTGGAGGQVTGGAGGQVTGGAGGQVTGGAGGQVTGGAGGQVTGGAGGQVTGGAGGQVNDCAATCDGCCDSAGRCLPGTDANACGASGAECSDCGSSGFGCVNGACQGQPPTCGPANCKGCCDGLGRCRLGTELDACGVAGGACKVCSAASGGTACSAGVCRGSPPKCDATTCGGCCNAAGACVTGTGDAACGAAGESCENCAASGRKCNQPGSYCTFVPSCSATTCPGGCCDASGVCRNGRTDAACGASGQRCQDCGASGQQCAASGFCYDGPHCGPDNCGGCCTANGQCAGGTRNVRCGVFGNLCDNCSTKGQVCQDGACAARGATCPAGYGGCNPGALTTPPAVSASCSVADLEVVARGCAGAQAGPECRAQLASLLRRSPACFDCLQPFTGSSGVAACLAPFLGASCNHDLTCALACSAAVCGQCGAGQLDACQSDAFTATGECKDYVNGTFCATAAFGGPGAFCDLERIGDVGAWLQGVGAYYCSE